jgi:flagellar hook-length control protein FliK
MKIVSDNSEVRAQARLSSDYQAPPPAESGPDSFLDIIMNTSGNSLSQPQADEDEVRRVSDTDHDRHSSDEDDDDDSNAVLNQLNMIHLINNEQVTPPPVNLRLLKSADNLENELTSTVSEQKSPEATLLSVFDMNQSSQAAAKTALDTKLAATLDTKQNDLASTSELKQNAQPLLDEKNNQNPNIAFLDMLDAKQTSAASLLLNAPDFKQLASADDSTLADIKRKIEGINSSNKTLTEAKKTLPNYEQVDFTSETSSVPSAIPALALVPQKEPIHYDEKQNKYLDSLAQLGSFINEQTSREHFSAISKSDSPTPTLSSVMAEIKAQQSSDYHFNVEILPASAASIAKEVYDAKIKIYPPELGQVTAKLRVDKNGTELTILTENARVKEIVEANLAQLRQNFQQADIHLTQVNVHSQAPGGMETQAQTSDGSGNNGTLGNKKEINVTNNDTSSQEETKKPSSNAIVDTYA